jgi:8-oxo-dGTP pyrophosphatase MutT (NUDIX family)
LAKLNSVHITDLGSGKIFAMLAEKIATVLKIRRAQTISGNDCKPAAVLVPIQERADGDYLVLTKRADGLPTHKGQIAFPGGRINSSDANAVAAALRESYEEIGLPLDCVRILGQLDQVTAGYGFVVTPVVAVIPSYCQFRIDPAETAAVASVPIKALMESSNFIIDDHLSLGGHPSYHFYVNGWDVWGVTARIIVQFLELVYDFQVKKF